VTRSQGPERRSGDRPPLPAVPERSDRAPGEFFDVLWHLHIEAMRGAHWDIAYHLLAAALHCAELADNLALVTSVQGMAALHQEAIDALDPPSRYATSSAQVRGTSPLFTSLHDTARAIAGRLSAERTRRRKSGRNGGDPESDHP
jgi:hypothetical protein